MSGIPRSGSTVLASVLNQNPLLHTEPLSPLADLMLTSHLSLDCEQTRAAKRGNHAKGMVSRLPEMYYENTNKPVVIDRSRAWTSAQMKPLLLEYFDNPKVLCTVRNRADVLKSFEKLFERNNKDFYKSPMYESFLVAEATTSYAFNSRDPMYFFIDYDKLCENPKGILKEVYEFWELPFFIHNLNDIKQTTNEDDSVYGLIGMHDIKSSLGSFC